MRSCGGDYGTPAVFDPFTGRPKFVRAPGFIKLNITVEPQITGQGGTVVMGMNYLCRKDLCDGMIDLIFLISSLL